jgi:hypothetical protein
MSRNQPIAANLSHEAMSVSGQHRRPKLWQEAVYSLCVWIRSLGTWFEYQRSRVFLILYRDGGTCWDYRLRHLIFRTLYSRLHRRYYNSLLQTVPTLTVLTIALSCATPIPVLYRTLGALDCRPTFSARRLAEDWRLQALFLTANWLDDGYHYLPALFAGSPD